MTRVLAVLAVVLVAACAAATDAGAHPRWKHDTPLATPVIHEIQWYRAETNTLLRNMGEPRFPTGNYEYAFPEMRPWLHELWQGRYQEARADWQRFFAAWELQEHDWHRALVTAAMRFGVSYGWLHDCNHGEGGHNRYADNPISDATGTMQFMPGTFYAYADDAFRAADVPRRYLDIYSFVGQAYTSAYMFSRGLSSHWVGAGC